MRLRRITKIRLRVLAVLAITAGCTFYLLPMFGLGNVHYQIWKETGYSPPGGRLKLGIPLTGGQEIFFKVRPCGRDPASNDRTMKAVIDRLDEATSGFNCFFTWDYEQVGPDTIRIWTPEKFDEQWLEAFQRIAGDLR